MLPQFDENGNLPPGIHWTTWAEVVARFGSSSRRQELLNGLHDALRLLRDAGCKAVYVNGSFVTTKDVPRDFDACWDIEFFRTDRGTGQPKGILAIRLEEVPT
jgi:hypothetical protein